MSDDSDVDAIFAGLKDSFIESTIERLESLDSLIQSIQSGDSNNAGEMTDFRGQIHSIKGTGGTFGFPVVSIICHRLEEMIKEEREYSPDEFDLVQQFVDQIRKIIEQGQEPDETEAEEILASLPTISTPIHQDRAASDVKIVLVTPMAALRQLAEFYLSEHGCQVLCTESSVDAFRLTVENRPDLLVSSVQLETLSGIDLGRAVSAVSALKSTKISLLTSSADIGDLSADIPETFTFIRTDHMEDDIVEVLSTITR